MYDHDQMRLFDTTKTAQMVCITISNRNKWLKLLELHDIFYDTIQLPLVGKYTKRNTTVIELCLL